MAEVIQTEPPQADPRRKATNALKKKAATVIKRNNERIENRVLATWDLSGDDVETVFGLWQSLPNMTINRAHVKKRPFSRLFVRVIRVAPPIQV